MKRNFLILMLLPGVVSAFLACAGGRDLVLEAQYSTVVGNTTTKAFFEKSVFILTRFNFLIERSEEIGNSFYIETRWSNRPPLEDELEIGIENTRSRIKLRAKAREATSRSTISTRLNQVVFTAETEIMFEGGAEWQRIPLSRMRKDFFKRIAETMKTEFNTGVRVYD